MIDTHKYIVFKRDDLMGLLDRTPGIDVRNVTDALDTLCLDDALVIRKRDVFAASALYTYAHSIQTAIELAQFPQALDVEFLEQLRDYFAGEADDASRRIGRVPDAR